MRGKAKEKHAHRSPKSVPLQELPVIKTQDLGDVSLFLAVPDSSPTIGKAACRNPNHRLPNMCVKVPKSSSRKREKERLGRKSKNINLDEKEPSVPFQTQNCSDAFGGGSRLLCFMTFNSTSFCFDNTLIFRQVLRLAILTTAVPRHVSTNSAVEILANNQKCNDRLKTGAAAIHHKFKTKG